MTLLLSNLMLDRTVRLLVDRIVLKGFLFASILCCLTIKSMRTAWMSSIDVHNRGILLYSNEVYFTTP